MAHKWPEITKLLPKVITRVSAAETVVATTKTKQSFIMENSTMSELFEKHLFLFYSSFILFCTNIKESEAKSGEPINQTADL